MLKKILIADDEFLIRWSLSEALSQDGYEVKAVEDGDKAVEAIKNETFDFVITDLVMPGKNGWEVLEQVKAACAKAKVIIITAFSGQDTETVAKEKGAVGYIEKPEIIDKIKGLLKSFRPNGFNHQIPN